MWRGPWRQEGAGCPGAGVTNSCEPSTIGAGWELNSNPLQEQQAKPGMVNPSHQEAEGRESEFKPSTVYRDK